MLRYLIWNSWPSIRGRDPCENCTLQFDYVFTATFIPAHIVEVFCFQLTFPLQCSEHDVFTHCLQLWQKKYKALSFNLDLIAFKWVIMKTLSAHYFLWPQCHQQAGRGQRSADSNVTLTAVWQVSGLRANRTGRLNHRSHWRQKETYII